MNIKEIADFIKIPNLFRDVTTLIGGLASLLFFHVTLNLNLLSYLNISQLGRVETDFIILVLSFVWGRILFLLAEYISDVVQALAVFVDSMFLSIVPISSRWVSFKREWKFPHWKTKLSEFINPKKSGELILFGDVSKEINLVDKYEVVNNNPHIANRMERNAYQGIFLQIIVSTSVLATFFVSPYYFLCFLVSFYLVSDLKSEGRLVDYSLAKSIVKNKK